MEVNVIIQYVACIVTFLLYHCTVLYCSIDNPDIVESLYDCVDHITDALQPPSYLNNAGVLTVYVAYAINNLMSVSELDSTVTLDFYWRLYWMDERLNIPSLWEAVNKTSAGSGLIQVGAEVKELIRNDDRPLNIWQVYW